MAATYCSSDSSPFDDERGVQLRAAERPDDVDLLVVVGGFGIPLPRQFGIHPQLLEPGVLHLVPHACEFGVAGGRAPQHFEDRCDARGAREAVFAQHADAAARVGFGADLVEPRPVRHGIGLSSPAIATSIASFSNARLFLNVAYTVSGATSAALAIWVIRVAA